MIINKLNINLKYMTLLKKHYY